MLLPWLSSYKSTPMLLFALHALVIMKMLIAFLAVFLLACIGHGSELYIWSICTNSSLCICGSDLQNTVYCYEKSLLIHSCYCLHHDTALNKTTIGHCLSSCFYNNNSVHGRNFYQVKRYSVENASLFNHQVCNLHFYNHDTNREGRFCGRCKKNYGLAAYSYHYSSCIPCTDHGYKNWLRYLVVAFLPLTLFYFLVVLLRINVTSSHLNGLVFIAQCILSPLQQRIFDSWTFAENGGTSHGLLVIIRILTSTLGILNLDFMRTVYPHFCLHPNLNFIHITSLDYIIALYPFCLILLTYLLISLYDKQYRLIVLAWKPFKLILGCYQRRFSTQTSPVEIFASFILLSSVKILGVCFDLLAPTSMFDATGAKMKARAYYYDANIEYFGTEHLPFAVLALVMGLTFVVLPFLLLLVYPCGCFQGCLNHFNIRCQSLHIFMDAFQGSYKTQPYDLRYFSAYYIFLRFMLLVSVEYTSSPFYAILSAFVMIGGASIFAIARPYRNNFHNMVDTVLMLSAASFYIGYSADITGSLFDYQLLHIAQAMFIMSAVSVVLFILTVFIFKPIYTKLHKYWKWKRYAQLGVEDFKRDFAGGDSYSPLLGPRKNIKN